MTDENKIRGIKTVQGLTSCTYWEAVLKVASHYNNYMRGNAPERNFARGLAAGLALAFQRDGRIVRQDIERGTP